MEIKEVREHAKNIAVGFGKYVVEQGLIPTDPDEEWRYLAKIGIHAVYDTKDGEWITMEQLFDNYIKKLLDGE